MHLFVILASVAYSNCFILKHRFNQAQGRVSLNHDLPFNITRLVDHSGYSTVGWTKPGKYPEPDNDSVWLNQMPAGSYELNPSPTNACYQRNISSTLTMVCFIHVVSSFWWGDAIKISKKMSCITETYQFSLTSPVFGFTGTIETDLKDDYLQEYPDLSPPPKPWLLYDQIDSRVVLNGTIQGLRSGFFWFKPLYWASFYAGQKITLANSKSTSRTFRATYFYPVSRTNYIEGLFGFETSDGVVEDHIDPIQFEFYPSK
ncbi:hypothetical protein DSO57_1028071 [Entomophthora muscae]|uniref:Uncharacterized protein n=1 Tax=Entomophthora muscae TaxID=34485 RepID=A0ACC2S413_9FUNG|nr:hypothetical protein DSO57_1028071 [Entomophthora muscae]